jgi:hypothetical protein
MNDTPEPPSTGRLTGVTAPSTSHRVSGPRREPRARLFPRAPRRSAAAGEHAPWCVQHGPAGCEGQVFSLPGTQLLVWLSAPSADDPRLVVEGPDGITQLPVQA